MINLFQPNISKDSINLLQDVFQSKWLGRGDKVAEFEDYVSSFISCKNIHTIASASDGILGSFDIFGLQTGDEVIMPTNSFPVLGTACLLKGLKVIFTDIEVATGNICLKSLKDKVSDRTRVVFITHYGGIPVNVDNVRKIVGDGVFIFEDSACALGTTVDGAHVGTDADFSVWSFDAMKLVVCGEGGMISLGDEELFTKAKEYFYLGLPANKKSGLDTSKNDGQWWEYELKLPGVRSVFTNINAAIGIPQILEVQDSLDRKKRIASRYDNELRSDVINHRKFLKKDNLTYSNYFYTIQSDQRDELAKVLLENGVYTSLRYSPLHKMEIFDSPERLVSADCFFAKSLNIPIHSSLADREQDKIIRLINNF